MDQLVPLEFTGLYKCLATLRTHVNPRPVRVKVLPHGRVVAKHLGAAFVGTRDSSGDLVKPLLLRLYPGKIFMTLGSGIRDE